MNNKNIFFLLFIFALYSNIVQGQYLPFYENKVSENALQMMNLKGNVKSITQTSFIAVNQSGSIQKGEKGNASDQGSVDSNFSMQFDKNSRAIKETYFNVWSVNELTVVHAYQDSKKIEIIEEFETPDTLRPTFIYTYKYDSIGKMREESISQSFKDNSTFTHRIVYKYDANNKLTENTCFELKGSAASFVDKTIFKYDNKGNKISRGIYNEKNVLGILENFKYDDLGNISEHDYFNSDCKTIDHMFKYKYDKGDVIEKKYFNPADVLLKTYSYKYEYDTQGNWIKRIDSEDGKPTFILERTILYY